MSEWKKYSSKDVYRIITNDITDSVHRYFAPVVGLIHGFGETIGAPTAPHPRHREVEQQQKDKKEAG
ncbi:hypothetical protein FXV83_14235 [Bradyrhizobium hipponense]|uniref:Uncharacterized protein n=1 Tax=Bradyrhizobium hipponense TaxID=2605638 RepID=A0A5S4YNX4_9BRAD|nr:hypothetical protein [Bradyrhizobium hipponense]TYO65838.1 hypothetical protein FXV83_14235 [Bradyrhizobium hipponense]